MRWHGEGDKERRTNATTSQRNGTYPFALGESSTSWSRTPSSILVCTSGGMMMATRAKATSSTPKTIDHDRVRPGQHPNT
jgi:hypothetical protein